MIPRVRLTSAAESDVVEITDWYERESPGLSARWFNAFNAFNAFDEALARAAENPQACSSLEHDLRKVRLDRFPHVLVFFLANHDRELWVIAVLGDGQDWDRVLTDRLS